MYFCRQVEVIVPRESTDRNPTKLINFTEDRQEAFHKLTERIASIELDMYNVNHNISLE